MAASTLTSANPNNSYYYDLFISHHGRDTKKTFASLLYHRLLSFKLRVFLDQPELQKGDYFSSQIVSAIKTASVQVAIFSPRYADSTWCLNELVLMLQTLETGATVIPVFYDVDPSELRWTERDNSGRYAKALQTLEKKETSDPQTHGKKPRYDPATIEKWRYALSEAAYITGFERKAFNGDEGTLLEAVVESVMNKVKKPPLNVAKYPIGLREKVKDFKNRIFLQRQQSAKPHLVGIVGPGGVGKTTLAKELFNLDSSHYSRSCFLPGVREEASKSSLVELQKKLLKSLIGSDLVIENIPEGIDTLKKHLSSYKVFVILDDVDDTNQVEALFPVQTVLHSDSLILITSRSKDVLISSGIEDSSVYTLTGLSTKHSRELFCLHSTNQPSPLAGFETLVEMFSKACDGLPLSLVVIGAHLYKKDEPYWREQFDRLQERLPRGIIQILKISYDALDIQEKEIFLDIACFLVRQNLDSALRIWAGSGRQGPSGFQNLQNRCLVTVDSENGIHMHDHIRHLGREVAESSLPPRLWRWTDHDIICKLLRRSEISVRGIKMDVSDFNDNEDIGDDIGAIGDIRWKKLQLLDTEGDIFERVKEWVSLQNLVWLRWKKCQHSSLRSLIPVNNLRVLQVSGSKLKTLWEVETEAPLKLRELEIYAPLRNIRKSIGRLTYLERIVVGRFLSGRVNLTELPEEFCDLQSLKELVLKECSRMKSLPDSFGKLKALQHIDLSFCRNLESLPNSVGELTDLQHMDLSNCYDLNGLPDSFGSLTNLQHIDLRECHNLKTLPDSFGNLRNLRHINLSACHGLKRLPNSFCDLINLQYIDLSGCHNLERLPESFGNLMYLQHINLSNCHDLVTLPESFDNLRNLQHIDLSRCHNLERLPNSLQNLSTPNLCLEGCSYLIK